jgi:aspartokinase-like uncharacterized kinase
MSETVHFEEKEYKAYAELAKKTGFKTVDELVNTPVLDFIRNELIEKEEVTILIPKKLLKMVQVLRSKDWEKYLSDSVADSIAADIHAGVFGNFNEVIKDFGLTEEFQFYEGH